MPQALRLISPLADIPTVILCVIGLGPTCVREASRETGWLIPMTSNCPVMVRTPHFEREIPVELNRTRGLFRKSKKSGPRSASSKTLTPDRKLDTSKSIWISDVSGELLFHCADPVIRSTFTGVLEKPMWLKIKNKCAWRGSSV